MTTTTDLKHVAYLAKHFGKLRSFALESLLHAALNSMDAGLNGSTGHTLGQNVDAMAALIGEIRKGSSEKGLEATVFSRLLRRDDIDSGTVSEAESLLGALEAVRSQIDAGNPPAARDLDALFETYTAFRIRTSGFLRQAEQLTETWRQELEQSKELRSKMSTTIADLEQMSGAINILAINASVEASRAGQGGAAFRVIAHEMQRLSDDSSDMLRTTRRTLGL